MQDKTHFNKVIVYGLICVWFTIGLFPFLLYINYETQVGEGVHEVSRLVLINYKIVLTNLPLKEIYLQVIMFVLIFSIIVVYPIMLYPAFKIFEFYFFKTGKILLKQNIFRTGIVIITVLIGIGSIGNFDSLLAITGSVLCTPLAVIFPAIFHFQLYKSEQSMSKNIMDITVFIIGCSISIGVFLFTVISGFN